MDAQDIVDRLEKVGRPDLANRYKHLGGKHNQARHGWRFAKGGDEAARLHAARRSMRGRDAGERAEYRKRAGMPQVKPPERKQPTPKTTGAERYQDVYHKNLATSLRGRTPDREKTVSSSEAESSIREFFQDRQLSRGMRSRLRVVRKYLDFGPGVQPQYENTSTLHEWRGAGAMVIEQRGSYKSKLFMFNYAD